MIEPKVFKATVVGKFRDYLESQGMKKRIGPIYTAALSIDSLKWLSITTSSRLQGHLLEVVARPGVRNQTLQKLVTELKQEKFHPFLPPSLSVQLGYLTPQNRFAPVYFASDRELGPPIEQFKVDFEQYGLSFYESHATLEALCWSLEHTKHSTMDDKQYQLPVCYFLLGDKEKAREYAAARLADLEKDDRPAIELQRYREYTTRLEALLRTGPQRIG